MSHYNTSSSQQQPPPPARYSGGSTDGDGGIEEGEGEEVVEYKHQLPPMQPYILGEDEKIPLFLVKMWNIVEDPANFDVIRWDDSGYSFHITDPYSFCRNVLPQFFKHNNLNSLIRQLNMYGFRKMTPIERTSLARAESDQDHLEFSHPFFVRDHPELLINIKRKVTNSKQHEQQAVLAAKDTATTAPSKDLTAVYEELHHLRERQKIMETKMTDLVKENELIWREMDHMRGAHFKQQQIVNKLVQFLVALVQPANKQQRLGKRQLLAIDERAVSSKRSRAATGSWEGGLGEHARQDRSHSTTQLTQQNTTEMLDQLMEELGRVPPSEQMLAGAGAAGMPSAAMRPQRPDSGSSGGSVSGPIIAEVTDEFDQLSGGSTLAQQQAQPLYSAYVDNINRHRQQPKPRYATQVNRNYPKGGSGEIQAPPRDGAAVEHGQLNPPLTYLPPHSKGAPNTSAPHIIMPLPQNNASDQQSMPMQSAPRYFTRQYQQQLQQPQQPIHQGQAIQYRTSGIPISPLISPSVPVAQRSNPSISSPHPTFPISSTPQQQQQLPPSVVTANSTAPPPYSPVSPSVNTVGRMQANTAYGADPLMVSTIQPEPETSGIIANDGEKPAGTELTEDEFNEYLNQNDLAINNLRGQFGNIWDFDSLFDLEDSDHPQVITDAGEKSCAGSPYLATENGNERPAALSPLSNVPTETPVRNCTKTRKN